MASLIDFNHGLLFANNSNGTTPDVPQYLGFISCAVSATFYGTNFIPVKKFETGDGMFFQWVLCNAIFIVGLVIQIVRTSQFYSLVMVGGAIWATGNICVVPIIKTIGLGLGLCVWGSINLLVGWATGRFGLFGLKASIPNDIGMNYAGVSIAVFSSVIYSLVKPEISPTRLEMTVSVSEDTEPLLNENQQNIQTRRHSGSLYGSNSEDILVFNKRRSSSSMSKSNDNGGESKMEDDTLLDRMSPVTKKIVGLSLSVFSGVMYGAQFMPAIYVQEHHERASQNSLDYVFAHFCGIYLTSTVYFVLYIIYKRNQPLVYPKVILPGLVSGAMWGIATAGWFIANAALSEPVSFPIISTIPGGIALALGIIVFREIRGLRNILISLVAMSFTVTGAVLAGMSKS
ncbi:transmembrane protein 144-like isoform X1 [Haliotis cracherodii]|uniref:transmembrane protein 144-like isoform X1 n=1 Tax=Haliotis cracherodii TaxID=6455 RepID=UPI0039EC4E23